MWTLKNNLKFISAFAANDPDSTFKVWELIKTKDNYRKCIFKL